MPLHPVSLGHLTVPALPWTAACTLAGLTPMSLAHWRALGVGFLDLAHLSRGEFAAPAQPGAIGPCTAGFSEHPFDVAGISNGTANAASPWTVLFSQL